MNLLVTDYDGTLKPLIYPLKNLKTNCEAINKFRHLGNKVMISTARSYYSITKEIKKYNIPYDYLSCFDGGLLLDKNNNLIKSFPIQEQDFNRLISNLKNLCIGENILIEKNIYNEPMEIIVLYNLKNYLKDLKKLEALEYILPNLECLKVPLTTFIRTKGGKNRTIDYLSNNEDYERIVTIGDNLNDLSMLKDYEGYKISMNCTPLMLENIPKASSVKSLIKKISK